MSEHDNEFDEIPFDLANEVPDSVSARSAERAQRAGYGTSITVPNQDIPVEFKPWRFGIDSLYPTFDGAIRSAVVERWKVLKEKAKDKQNKHEAQYEIGAHIFEVKPFGRNGYNYVLTDGSYEIEAVGASNRPLFTVKILSGRLGSAPLSVIMAELTELLALLTVSLLEPNLTRADVCMDFSYRDEVLYALNKECFVGSAKKKTEFSESDDTTGWHIGAGGTTMARLYNKSAQLDKFDDGSYGYYVLREQWLQADWDGEETIWRIEFQLRGTALQEFTLRKPADFEARYRDLWEYLTSKWLKICTPSATDTKRSRWQEQDFWIGVRNAARDKEYPLPIVREPLHDKKPSKEHLSERLVMAGASFAAESDADSIVEVKKLVFDVFNNLDMLKGPKNRPLDKVLTQTLARRRRSYNIRKNKAAWREKLGLPEEDYLPPESHYEEEIPF